MVEFVDEKKEWKCEIEKCFGVGALLKRPSTESTCSEVALSSQNLLGRPADSLDWLLVIGIRAGVSLSFQCVGQCFLDSHLVGQDLLNQNHVLSLVSDSESSTASSDSGRRKIYLLRKLRR